MKVSNIIPLRIEGVEMEDGSCYERASAAAWWRYYAKQLHPVYDCTGLEKAYQAYREKHESQ